MQDWVNTPTGLPRPAKPCLPPRAAQLREANIAQLRAIDATLAERCRVQVAGASEACIDALSLAGFSRLKALTVQHNETPEQASRPFDAARAGFVMGEGAGVVILESKAHAASRGARAYAEVRTRG